MSGATEIVVAVHPHAGAQSRPYGVQARLCLRHMLPGYLPSAVPCRVGASSFDAPTPRPAGPTEGGVSGAREGWSKERHRKVCRGGNLHRY